LGFSASGFAALGLAASNALGLNLDTVELSEVVRLGAGSSTRSLAGGFAVWYSDRNGRSYAEQLDAPKRIDFSMVIVPVYSGVKTDEAHAEVVSSPLFKARLKNVDDLLKEMRQAIKKGDTATVFVESSCDNYDWKIAHGALGARNCSHHKGGYSIKGRRNFCLVFH
jgi:mevalonate pyrophosphate decarboxylase